MSSATTTNIEALIKVLRIAIIVLRLMSYGHGFKTLLLFCAGITIVAINKPRANNNDRVSHSQERIGPGLVFREETSLVVMLMSWCLCCCLEKVSIMNVFCVWYDERHRKHRAASLFIIDSKRFPRVLRMPYLLQERSMVLALLGALLVLI